MRRCLNHSRFLATTTAQPSWRLAIQNKNASVNALVHVVPEGPGNVTDGLLNDMTVAVKDNICTKDMPTTCSSAMLRGRPRSCVLLGLMMLIFPCG